MLITANRWFNQSFAQYKINALIPALVRRGITIEPKVAEAKPLTAFVNQGRWLIKCECGGAEYAWEEGLFMCQSCWNSRHKHNFRQSVFPAERHDIEKLLKVRPLLNRNYLLSDTVAILEAENNEHKTELLGVS